MHPQSCWNKSAEAAALLIDWLIVLRNSWSYVFFLIHAYEAIIMATCAIEFIWILDLFSAPTSFNPTAVTSLKRIKYGALLDVLSRARNPRSNYDHQREPNLRMVHAQHDKLDAGHGQHDEPVHLNEDSDSSSTPSSANAAYSRPRIKNPTKHIFDSLDLSRNMSNGVSSHQVDIVLSDESTNGTHMPKEVILH